MHQPHLNDRISTMMQLQALYVPYIATPVTTGRFHVDITKVLA
jgi:hypothetical protein